MASPHYETKTSGEHHPSKTEILSIRSTSPEDSDSTPQNSVIDVVQAQPKRNWKSYVWDTFDKSPEERRFLFKLDAFLLTFASLG
jgi:MFS transporter, ACS family, pantothenate transporter